MGLFKKLVGVLTRKVNRFNVENRAHKVLERDKPVPAPKYESNLKDLEFARKGKYYRVQIDWFLIHFPAAPDFIAKQNVKDGGLDDRLKKVFVTSQEPQVRIRCVQESRAGIQHSFPQFQQHQLDPPIQRQHDEDKPLPSSTKTVDYFEFGYLEPIKITPGRCSLRQATQFILDHGEDPKLWTKEKIAEEYKMKVENIENILKYFRTFAVHLPKKEALQSKASKLLDK